MLKLKKLVVSVAKLVKALGCGPGDPELITVKGMRLLKDADTIIYDRLINSRMLDFAKPNAELINVGKSSKSTKLEQEKINQMLNLLQDYKTICLN